MEQSIAALIERADLAFTCRFDGVLRIEVEKDGQQGAFWVDGRASPPEVLTSEPAGEGPVCVWRAGPITLNRALDGERAFASAFVSGRLLIRGDMAVMARLKIEANA